MWLRFDKKIGYVAKSGLIKKLLSGYIIVLMLFSLFSMAFMATAGAKEILPKISDDDDPVVVDDDPVDDDPVVVDDDPVDDDPVDDDPVVVDDDPVDDDPVVVDDDPVDDDPVVVDDDPVVVDDDPVVEAESEKDNIKIETVLGNISKGKKTEVISENYMETDVYSVSFTPSIDLKGVKLTVSTLEYKPEEIMEIPTKNNSVYVYQYLDIKLTADDEYIEEDGIESMRFEFKVKWSWINENNIDKKTILLVRYHDTEWQNLTTTYLGENDTYVYYEAETPGLSTFAVVGSELVESSASYVEEVPEMPWILNMGIIASSSTMLFVVIFKARYIYFDEEEQGTKGSKKRLSRKFR
jgi:PGF-pre-PGF domain-containing protein